MVPRLHPKSQTHTGGASVGLFFPWGPATPLSGGPKCPPALLYQWHEGLRPRGLERGYLPSVCVWGGGIYVYFSLLPGGDPLEDGWGVQS